MQLLTMSDRPTAVFSANNLMVIGAMRAIRDMGLSCPEDISVACMDDFPWADVFSPRLTTIAQPVEAIGEQAVSLLLDRLTGKSRGCSAPARASGKADRPSVLPPLCGGCSAEPTDSAVRAQPRRFLRSPVMLAASGSP